MARTKKDFSNITTDRVYSTIASATAEPEQENISILQAEETQEKPDTQEITKKRKARKTYTEQEAAEVKQTLNTTGRKGCGLPRINLAFTEPNYEYISVMARVTGQNLTAFVNGIIDKHRQEHDELYNKAMEFRNSLQ